jgi:hypothetical protein
MLRPLRLLLTGAGLRDPHHLQKVLHCLMRLLLHLLLHVLLHAPSHLLLF